MQDKILLDDFKSFLLDGIEEVWKNNKSKKFHTLLTEKTAALAAHIIEIGDQSFEYLQEHSKESGKDTAKHYTINYQWTEQAKLFMILWRDVCFELLKAQILQLSGAVSRQNLDQLFIESKETLAGAARELFESRSEIRYSRIGLSQKERQLAAWYLQENPWPVYKEQITEISLQSKELRALFLELGKTLNYFQDIRQAIFQSIAHFQEDLQSITRRIEKIIGFIKEHMIDAEEPKPGKLMPFLEDIEKDQTEVDRAKAFTEQLEEKIAQLPTKQRVPVGVQLGWVQYKEMDFKKSVQQYLESEVQPLLFEIWEVAGRIHEEEKSVLLNIRNRALLLSNEIKEGKKPDSEQMNLSQPLRSFFDKTEKVLGDVRQLHSMIESRMKKEFQFSLLFHPSRDFLPIPIQYSFNSFLIDRYELLGQTRQWLYKQLDRLRQFRQKVEIEDTLSISEKTVRYILSRQVRTENNHYASIFLTKGYIGESFWVGRETQLHHLENLIHNWNQGFRGAVSLSGRRLSGRSFFGDIVSNRFFPDNTIRVRPDQELILSGRRFQIGYDLEEALQAIRKYSFNNRPFIWIDDLELWSDTQIPFSKNVKTLLKFIDDYSNRMFFIVSMTNWAKDRINQFHQADKVFQTDLNLDRMPPDDIGEALLIRHGATHKSLIDVKGNEVNPNRFRKMVGRVLSVADGNIGDALNLWAASIEKAREEQVFFHFKSSYILPDSFETDVLLILSTILLEKQTNEYRLSKLFGPAFSKTYNNTLQRLLNIGLVERQMNGLLEINPLAVNDVAKILYRKKYLIPRV